MRALCVCVFVCVFVCVCVCVCVCVLLLEGAGSRVIASTVVSCIDDRIPDRLQ